MKSPSIQKTTFSTLSKAVFKSVLNAGGNWDNYFKLVSYVGWKVYALTFPWINSENQPLWPKKDDTIVLYDKQIAEALFYKATSIEADSPKKLLEEVFKIITENPESIEINENIGTE